MISASGVHKRFGAVEVLRGVDLRLAPGRVTAIVGPNGAGKTTLIKAMLGLTRPDAGTLTFDGQPVTDDGAYRARIGYMPQLARFPENLTGRELLALLCELRNSPPTDERLLEQFVITDILDKPLRVLTGGTRQKINAAAAFLFAPPCFILDEPTAGLDPVAAGVLKRRISAERTAGATVLLTSHIMSEIDELADDVAFLVDGRVAFHGELTALKRLAGESHLERAIAELMLREEAA
jgi:Cu-processing system ATP-binding protein